MAIHWLILLAVLGTFLLGLLLGFGFWCGYGYWQSRNDLKVAKMWESANRNSPTA